MVGDSQSDIDFGNNLTMKTVFIKDKQSGKYDFTFVCLKNSNSVNKFKIYIKQKKIKKTFIKDDK